MDLRLTKFMCVVTTRERGGDRGLPTQLSHEGNNGVFVGREDLSRLPEGKFGGVQTPSGVPLETFLVSGKPKRSRSLLRGTPPHPRGNGRGEDPPFPF